MVEDEENKEFKAFKFDGSPKSSEEVLEAIRRDQENGGKGVLVKSVPGTFFPNNYKVERSDYHQGSSKQLSFAEQKKELEQKLA